MRKLGFFIIVFFVTLHACRMANAQGQETIQAFESFIKINSTGFVEVTEVITYDFGQTERHGIIREIQDTFVSDSGAKSRTPIEILSVQRQGKNEEYSTGRSTTATSVKIGNANKTVLGTQKYTIKYIVEGALESFSDHDELYWNTTGNDWEVPIKFAYTQVELPKNVSASSISTRCFTGITNSQQSRCSVQVLEENKIVFTTNQLLTPGEGISIVAGFEKGKVTILPKQNIYLANLATNTSYMLIGTVWYILVPSLILIHFLRNGRDPKTKYTSIPPLFEAPTYNGRKLTPAEVGTIFDEKIQSKDVTATIIDLAIRGFIKIEPKKDDSIFSSANFTLHKTDQALQEHNLQAHEKELISLLFGGLDTVETKNLENNFVSQHQKFKSLLYKNLVEEGFFPNNPEQVRTKWIALGVISLFTINLPLGLVAIALANFMPKKTLMGATTKMEIEGLKKFITSQDKQMEFMEKNWMLFEKMLPYAIVFGVTRIWTERFKDLFETGQYQARWISGENSRSVVAFSSFVNGFGNKMGNIATSVKSSSGHSSGFSGSGRSGGGFGGGGGGRSW